MGQIILKSDQEIDRIKQAGDILYGCLQAVKEACLEKVRTRDLDALAEDYIRSRGGVPAFKGYRNYPASLCISVNDEVVHGIPNGYRVKNGDILSVDCGVVYQGLIADSATTIPIGEITPEVQKLLKVTEESLYLGIEQARAGNYVHDISKAVQEYVEGHGFSVVRALVGHGVGHSMHEEPQVPNFVSKERGARLEAGMVIAIEPMVNTGTFDVRVKKDGWTVVTLDHGYSAHYEHTVAITKDGPRILTDGK